MSDADIEWARTILGLPPNAFAGVDGNDPRLRVLRANDSIDVAACPGSGKTTLLVAKLAILAKQWSRSTQGICVLSHTNVARLEIERRLGGEATGRTILTYPHYVGTIHGFINSFIALPWLRSQGLQIVAIDDDICCRRRWNKLSHAQRSGLERNRRGEGSLRIVDAGFDLGDIPWGRGGTLGRNSDMYRALVSACREATEEGYFCHEDMLLWAEQALDQMPHIAQSVRTRFPLLFLDEVQDNSEVQSRLLHRIFTSGAGPVPRQRFGDMNQAIYSSTGDAAGADTDPFPRADVLIDVPNSHRFSQQIATAANPLALTPPGLTGLRSAREHELGRQTALLLFKPDAAFYVLPSFASLLVDRFSADERALGTFTAVGAIHRDRSPRDAPSCVAHYWTGYDQGITNLDAKPAHFLGYVRIGTAAAVENSDLRPVVERVAEGLIRLAGILNTAVRHLPQVNKHRQALALLNHDPRARKRYLALCWALATGKGAATAEQWERWKAPITAIAAAMLPGDAIDPVGSFLDWIGGPAEEPGVPARHGNVFAYPAEAPAVRIKVGSIHSVKGETHMATLVLDTYYKGSHLVRIKDWLTGARTGLAALPPRPELRASLKQHYVAVTRPSHLLCIAIREADLTEAELGLLRGRDWSIGDVGENEIRWRP